VLNIVWIIRNRTGAGTGTATNHYGSTTLEKYKYDVSFTSRRFLALHRTFASHLLKSTRQVGRGTPCSTCACVPLQATCWRAPDRWEGEHLALPVLVYLCKPLVEEHQTGGKRNTLLYLCLSNSCKKVYKLTKTSTNEVFNLVATCYGSGIEKNYDYLGIYTALFPYQHNIISLLLKHVMVKTWLKN